ncbi:NAD-dependent epimerase/dehydratase family protein [Sediminibacterium sp.]|uniref:NAD-dependent epimerase/dehydratase family protein n=1 Tax=Sediminibacterium sp. TaxID=1917865 RepID=UPI0025F2CEB0|nr:NAD-dependent epimerase/dehydratase family protein [Sediminibacterium sp.]
MSEYKRSKIYVTGSTGFVGKNLVKFLSTDNYTCISVDLRGEFSKISFDEGACIVHLAGKAHDVKNVSDPTEYYRVNFELSKLVFDQFLNSKASKFIFLSSVKAASDTPTGILSELDKPSPKTDYGKSKLMAEEYMLSKIMPQGKSIFILRPCMIHGPNNKGNLNLLFKFVKKGIPWPLGLFNNTRSFLSIDNLNFVIKELISQDRIKSGVYNICDDLPVSTNELVSLINNSIGKRNKIVFIPKWIIIFVFRIGDFLKLPYNSDTLSKLTENYVVDNSKIVKAIGKPLPINSKDGIFLTLLSFKSN